MSGIPTFDFFFLLEPPCFHFFYNRSYELFIFEDKVMEKLENVLLRKIIFIVTCFKMHFLSMSFCLGRKVENVS